MEVVENGAKNIEVAVIRRDKAFEFMSQSDVSKICDQLTKEKEELVKQGRAGEPIVMDSEY